MPMPPEGPEGFDKINYVIDSWARPCEAPWYIYLETLKPAALEAFIVLITFGWADVFRGAFRPKGLGRRTGKKKGKWVKKIPAFPEIGNTIGKNLPIAEQIDDYIKWGQGATTLWRIDTLIQAGLFWWLVADVAEDFAFNWTSALYKTYWCKESSLGRFSYRNAGYSAINNNVWKVAGFAIEDYEYAPPQWNFNTGSTGGVECTIFAALRVKQRPPFGVPTKFRVVVRDLITRVHYADSGLQDVDPSEPFGLAAKGRIPKSTGFEVVAWMEGASFADYGDGVVVGFED